MQDVLVAQRFIRSVSPTLAVETEMQRRLSAGKQVFKLGFGGSPLPPTDSMVKALQESAYQSYYPETQGEFELRQSIVEFYEREFNLTWSPDRIFVFQEVKRRFFSCCRLSMARCCCRLPAG